MRYLTGIVALIVFTCSLGIAQETGTGSARGTVFDGDNGDPILFTNVVVEGTTLGSVTDVNGFYAIPNIPLGTYQLICTSIGYDTARITITIEKNGQIINKNLYISESSVQLNTVQISAERQERESDVRVSTTKITTEEITQIPSIGGEPDLAQYLQIMPGVVFTGDQGGQLYIRGGSPVQTLVLLDGLPIYNPFHSIGLFSVFETDIIKNVEIMTGGFGAEYGGRVSAVMDIRTQDGNKKQVSGSLSASPFMAKLVLNGPLVKQQENGSSLTYVLSGRYSYLDKTSETLYPWVDGDDGIPFGFRDFYGKLSYNAGRGSKFSVFGFNFRDDANFLGTANYGWNAFGIGTNFIIVPGNANTIVTGTAGYSNYDISLKEAEDQPRESFVGGYNIRLKLYLLHHRR